MFLKHPGKLFRASAILEFPKFQEEMNFFKNYVICPKLTGRKKLQNFSIILENISQEFSRVPKCFGYHGKNS
jgi:hypothetical protein